MYRKFEKPKKLYIFKKILILSVICNNCKNGDEEIFEEGEESIKMLNIISLIETIIALKVWLKKV